MYFGVSMTTMNKEWPQALFPIITSSLLKLANHSGEFCTQVYLSVSMMSTSLRHSISIHTIGIFIGAFKMLCLGEDKHKIFPQHQKLGIQYQDVKEHYHGFLWEAFCCQCFSTSRNKLIMKPCLKNGRIHPGALL